MARRASFQLGCVFKRGRKGKKVYVGRWRVRVLQADNSPGWTHRSIVLGPATISETEARKRLQKYLAPVNEGKHTLESQITFGQFVSQEWEPARPEPGIRREPG